VLTLPALGTRHVLRLSPPLVISREQVDLVLNGLGDLCAQIERGAAAALLRGMGWTNGHGEGDGGCVALPAPAPRPQVVRFRPRRHWAFLIHYPRAQDVHPNDPSLATLTEAEALGVCGRAAQLPAGVVLEAPTLRSVAGEEVDGWLVGLPWLPEHMPPRPRADA
jgi:hypothetical protein